MLRRILVLTAHRHVWENSERQLAPRRQRTRAPRRRTSTGKISTTALTARRIRQRSCSRVDAIADGSQCRVHRHQAQPQPGNKHTGRCSRRSRPSQRERPAFHADTFPPPPRTSAHSSPCSFCVPSPTCGARALASPRRGQILGGGGGGRRSICARQKKKRNQTPRARSAAGPPARTPAMMASLAVRPAAPPRAAPPRCSRVATRAKAYTVLSGDSLSKIAESNKVTTSSGVCIWV